jgi:hypothetical protein
LLKLSILSGNLAGWAGAYAVGEARCGGRLGGLWGGGYASSRHWPR